MKYAKLPVVLLSSFASMKRDSTNGAIVDFILKNINEDLTVKMVAEGAHVGNASVSRFIKDLGLSGFSELRELILYSDCQFIFVDSSNVENEVFESCTHALEIAKNSVDVQRIDVLCDAIKQAKEIAIFGLGKAECAAICLQMDLFSLGKNAYSSIQYSEQIEYIKQAEKDCLIILFQQQAVTLNIMIYVNGRIRFNDLMYGILVLALCLILFRTAFLIGFRMKMFLTQCN